MELNLGYINWLSSNQVPLEHKCDTVLEGLLTRVEHVTLHNEASIQYENAY